MSDLNSLEDLIYTYKNESDNKKKHILYLNLVEEGLKLVKKIVTTLYPLPISVSRDDLIQVGAIGLLKSIDSYQVKEKGSFKTYCTICVKGKILQYLRDKANIVKTPRETLENINRVKTFIEGFESEFTPSVKTIAAALKLDEKKVQDILNLEQLKNILSLDQRVYSSDGIETLADRLQSEDDKNYEQNYENKKVLEFALNKLPEIEKKVICLYFIDGLNKKEIAKKISVSQTQVSRLIKRALNKMYNILKDDILVEKEDE